MGSGRSVDRSSRVWTTSYVDTAQRHALRSGVDGVVVLRGASARPVHRVSSGPTTRAGPFSSAQVFSCLFQVVGAVVLDQRGDLGGQRGVRGEVGIVVDQGGRLVAGLPDDRLVPQQRQQPQL